MWRRWVGVLRALGLAWTCCADLLFVRLWELHFFPALYDLQPHGAALLQLISGCTELPRRSRLLLSLKAPQDSRIEDIPLELQGPIEVRTALQGVPGPSCSPVVLKNIYSSSSSTAPTVSTTEAKHAALASKYVRTLQHAQPAKKYCHTFY